jgi:hypothetical protein
MFVITRRIVTSNSVKTGSAGGSPFPRPRGMGRVACRAPTGDEHRMIVTMRLGLGWFQTMTKFDLHVLCVRQELRRFHSALYILVPPLWCLLPAEPQPGLPPLPGCKDCKARRGLGES